MTTSHTMAMLTGLQRFHGTSGFHFVMVSCFRRKPLLGTPVLRDLFQTILLETRDRYRFHLEAWVIMPEHVYLSSATRRQETSEPSRS